MQSNPEPLSEVAVSSQTILQNNADVAQKIAAVLANLQKIGPVADTSKNSVASHAVQRQIQLTEAQCALDIAPTSATQESPLSAKHEAPAVPKQQLNADERQTIRELLQENSHLSSLAYDKNRLVDFIMNILTDTTQANAAIDLLLRSATATDPSAKLDLSFYNHINLKKLLFNTASNRNESIQAYPVAFKIVKLMDVEFFILIYKICGMTMMLVLHFSCSNTEQYEELKKTCFLTTMPLPEHPTVEAVALFNICDSPTAIQVYQDFIVLGFATGEVTVYTINHNLMQPAEFHPIFINPSLLKLAYTHISTSHTPIIKAVLSRSYYSPVRGLIVTDVTTKSTSLRTKHMNLTVFYESNCIAIMSLVLDFAFTKGDQKICSQRVNVEPAILFEVSAKLCISAEKQVVFSSAVSAVCEFPDNAPLAITGHVAGTVVVRLTAGGSTSISPQSLSDVSKYLINVASSRCTVFETPVIVLVHSFVPSVCKHDEEVVVACSLGGQLASWIVQVKSMVAGLPLLALDDDVAPLFAPYYSWQGKADCGEAIVSAVLHGDKVVILTTSNRVVQYKIFDHAILELEDQVSPAHMLDTNGEFLALVNNTELLFI